MDSKANGSSAFKFNKNEQSEPVVDFEVKFVSLGDQDDNVSGSVTPYVITDAADEEEEE